jgi:hypothetical protein
MTQAQPRPIRRQPPAPDAPREPAHSAPPGPAAPSPLSAITQAVRASELPSSSRLVMLTLASTGEAVQIGLDRLAVETGLTKSTVRTHLAALEADGWLTVTRPSAEETARRVCPTYRVSLPAETLHTGVTITPVKVFTGPAITPVTGVTITPVKAFTGSIIGSVTGVTIGPPRASAPARSSLENLNIYLNQEDLSADEVSGYARDAAAPQPLAPLAEMEIRTTAVTRKPKTPIVDSPEFDRFWKAYPRRQAKGAARKAWAAHVIAAGVDVELVISAAEFFGLVRAGQDPKYTPHPATWLGREQWEDTPDPEYRELNKAELRNRDNVAGIIRSCEETGDDPMALLFPESMPEHPDVIRRKAEAEAWMRGEELPPRAPQEARRGGSEALAGRERALGRGQLF